MREAFGGFYPSLRDVFKLFYPSMRDFGGILFVISDFIVTFALIYQQHIIMIQRDWIFAAAAVGAVAVWLFAGNPEDPSAGFLKCPFHVLTGLQCPLCGMQRAAHHLLHLRFGRAFACNPWLVAIGVYAAVYATGRWRSKRALFIMLSLTAAWGIMRNLLHNI